MKTRLAIAALCCANTIAAVAADNDALIAFAKANADKFAAEVGRSSDGLRVGATVAVTGALDRFDMIMLLPDYDQTSGGIVFSASRVTRLVLFSECKEKGTYAGQNSYGATTTVIDQECETVSIETTDFSSRPSLKGVKVKMTPDQFRKIKGAGVQAVYRFTIGQSLKGIPFAATTGITSPTIQSPTRSSHKDMIIYGRIDEVAWLLPDETAPTVMWTRP